MAGRQQGIVVVAAVLLTTACLGQDYRDIELGLSDWDHGWLAVVEPDESFAVGLPENPQYPDAAWTVESGGDPVLDVSAPAIERPQGAPEEEGTLAFWLYDVAALTEGEAQLSFQLDADGRTVDRVAFDIAVVADACAYGAGITAPRCGGPQQVTAPQGASEQSVSEREHGSTVMLDVGEDVSVLLTGNAARPDAVWQLAAADRSVVDVSAPREVGSRTPGNWATDDASEPGTFLPRSEFLVTGVGPGRTEVQFALLDGDDVIEVAAFTVEVAGSR